MSEVEAIFVTVGGNLRTAIVLTLYLTGPVCARAAHDQLHALIPEIRLTPTIHDITTV